MIGPLQLLAAVETAQPLFLFSVKGPPNLGTTIRTEIANRPEWAIFAHTAFSRRTSVRFEGIFERKTQQSQLAVDPRGYAQVTLNVRVVGQPSFQVTDFAETQRMVYVTAKQDPYEVGFQEAENKAVAQVLPFVCARLVRMSGEAVQAQALLKLLEKEWPDDKSLPPLRELGPLAASWSDRLAGLVAKLADGVHAPDNALLALLAVDEKRGATLLADVKKKHYIDATGILNQHLELQGLTNDVGSMRVNSSFRIEWAEQLTPAGAEAIRRFAKSYPETVLICAEALLTFNNDPRADEVLEAIKVIVPEKAGEVTELITKTRENAAAMAEWKRQSDAHEAEIKAGMEEIKRNREAEEKKAQAEAGQKPN